MTRLWFDLGIEGAAFLTLLGGGIYCIHRYGRTPQHEAPETIRAAIDCPRVEAHAIVVRTCPEVNSTVRHIGTIELFVRGVVLPRLRRSGSPIDGPTEVVRHPQAVTR